MRRRVAVTGSSLPVVLPGKAERAMCQSVAEGGQRCYAHTSKKLAAAKANRDPDRPDTMVAYDEALVEHATTKKGRAEVEQWQRASTDAAERAMLGGVLHKASMTKHQAARMHVWTTQKLWLEPKAPEMVALVDHVDYEYDYYGPDRFDGCTCGDDYCRCARYEGLQITKVNAARVAADLLGVEADDPRAQAHIKTVIEDLRLDDVDTYHPESAAGYYGDRFTAEWAKLAAGTGLGGEVAGHGSDDGAGCERGVALPARQGEPGHRRPVGGREGCAHRGERRNGGLASGERDQSVGG